MSEQVAIDERIHQLVEAHRPELEQLVDQALARELEALIEERLAARNGANPYPRVGNAPAAQSERPEPSARTDATQVCEGCGGTKPETAFEKHRRRCRDCRRRDRRTAPVVEQAPAEPDRPADIDAWLVHSGFAEVNGDRLVPTDVGLQAGCAIADAIG